MIPPAESQHAHLRLLNQGKAQARTLTEALAIDHRILLEHAVPAAPTALTAAVDRAQSLGILKRMHAIGAALSEHLPTDHQHRLATHESDTVRGWACFAAAADPVSTDLEHLLSTLKPLADDPCFTVREWVWMAARPILVTNLDRGIDLLSGWTGSPSERIRRFASEALRPRGVWAKHIDELKQDPGRGLPLLEPLKADGARYVQDSVANWINDAAKTNPEWARGLCARWDARSPTPQTTRITTRALRSLR